MNVEDARARSERSGAAFGVGAPAGCVKASDTSLQLPHALLQCRVYTPVQDAALPLPEVLLMCAHRLARQRCGSRALGSRIDRIHHQPGRIGRTLDL